MKNNRNTWLSVLAAIAIICGIILYLNNQQKEKSAPEYSTGCIPSDPEMVEDIPIIDTTVISNIPISDLPGQFELDMPPVRDQGKKGSCCAFACAYAARSYLLQKDQSLSLFSGERAIDERTIMSPEFLYNSFRQPGTCENAGMQLAKALDSLKVFGVSTWSAMPYSPESNCMPPDSMQKKIAGLFKINKVERLANLSVNFIKKVLYAKNPIVFSAKIDNGFMNNGAVVWKKKEKPDRGGHAMVICGWDDEKHAFKVMNSWGKAWGDGGFGWIDYDFLPQVVIGKPFYEMFVMHRGFDSTLLPKITTIKGLLYNPYLFGGNIQDTGATAILESGVCYDTITLPTIKNYKITGTIENEETIDCEPLQGLVSGTTYYVRAFATNLYGTAYGNEYNFYYYKKITALPPGSKNKTP